MNDLKECNMISEGKTKLDDKFSEFALITAYNSSVSNDQNIKKHKALVRYMNLFGFNNYEINFYIDDKLVHGIIINFNDYKHIKHYQSQLNDYKLIKKFS